MGSCKGARIALLLFAGGYIFVTKGAHHGEDDSTPPVHAAPMDRRL